MKAMVSLLYYVFRAMILMFNKPLLFGISGEIRNKFGYIPGIMGWFLGNALGGI